MFVSNIIDIEVHGEWLTYVDRRFSVPSGVPERSDACQVTAASASSPRHEEVLRTLNENLLAVFTLQALHDGRPVTRDLSELAAQRFHEKCCTWAADEDVRSDLAGGFLVAMSGNFQ